MILYISHSFFDYEAGNLCRLFFPYEKLKTVTDINEAIEDDFIIKAIFSEEKSFQNKTTECLRRSNYL